MCMHDLTRILGLMIGQYGAADLVMERHGPHWIHGNRLLLRMFVFLLVAHHRSLENRDLVLPVQERHVLQRHWL